jgi:hypothetical protein
MNKCSKKLFIQLEIDLTCTYTHGSQRDHLSFVNDSTAFYNGINIF